jgi:predicted ATP-grasp superfamily ATP-dependent carboligase
MIPTRERTQITGAPPAVLLGGENGALPIARSLAQGGVETIIVASERPDDQTFHSRYCSRKVVLQRFDKANDAHNIGVLKALAESLAEKPILFWGSDRETLFIHRNRKCLAQWYRFLLPDEELTDSLVDKGRFAEFARRKGLPVPETRVFHGLRNILRERYALPYPCTVKPVYMSLWYSDFIKKHFGTYKHVLQRIASPEELVDYVCILPNIDKGIVVQRFIEGQDDELYSFHGYFNSSSEPVASFVGRKIRTNPIHFGGSAYIETIHRPDLMEFCQNVCKRIHFRGVVKIDCKRDTRTGQIYILEFNLRFNLWEHLGTSAGINIPRIWYDDLAGNNHEHTPRSYEAGRRWLYFAADLRALPQYLKSGEWTLRSWITSYRAPKVYHTLDWHDPLPLLFSLPRFLKRKLQRLRLLRAHI